MSYTGYILLGLGIGGVFFGLAAWALYWAVKNGQFENLDKGSRVIFDEEEPEGEHTDYFPGKNPRDKNSSQERT